MKIFRIGSKIITMYPPFYLEPTSQLKIIAEEPSDEKETENIPIIQPKRWSIYKILQKAVAKAFEIPQESRKLCLICWYL